MKRSGRTFFILTFFICFVSIPLPGRGERVTLSYTATTLSFLVGKVAVERGLFRDEGLDVGFVQVRPPVVPVALSNGHIDYTMSILPPIDGALKGLPVQMKAVFTDRSLHYLVTRPNIKSGGELRGKTFVLNSLDLSGSTGLVYQAILRHFGLDPFKDAKVMAAADSPALFAMLQQRLVDATVLVPPWPERARKAGFNVLFRVGDIYSSPLAALSTYRRTLRENPNQVRRMLRAMVRAARFILQPSNKPAVASVVQQWLKMPLDEATESLNDVIFAYTDGVPRDEKGFWELIENRAKLLSSNVPASEVADFSLVKEIRMK